MMLKLASENIVNYVLVMPNTKLYQIHGHLNQIHGAIKIKTGMKM